LIKIAKLIISTKLLFSCFYSCRYLWFTNFGTHIGAHFQSVKHPFFSITSQLYRSTFLCCDLWHCWFPLTINPVFNKIYFLNVTTRIAFGTNALKSIGKVENL